MWFEDLMGFKEESPEQVRRNIRVKKDRLTSLVNGKSYQYGTLEIPTVQNLRDEAPDPELYLESIRVEEVVGDVQQMHRETANAGALFQAASQFNLLEMVAPSVSPEAGVGIYEMDRTQGPACAIACGAGTIYRNYFVKLGTQVGQSATLQVDALEELGKALNNDQLELWNTRNGYAFASQAGLEHITRHLDRLDEVAYRGLLGKLKVGIQWDTEVTLVDHGQLVSQVYCSALPIGYSQVDRDYWQGFAQLILRATYEATFYAALRNYEKTGNPNLYLTLVGGGVFANDLNWIFTAIEEVIMRFRQTPLKVKIVSYGQSDTRVRTVISKWTQLLRA